MRFCRRWATSRKGPGGGGGGNRFCAPDFWQNAPHGGRLGPVQVCVCPFFVMWKQILGCFASNMTDLGTLSWCRCFTYEVCQGCSGPIGWHGTTEASNPLTNLMVVAAPHTSLGGGGGGLMNPLRCGPTPKRVPHTVPHLARCTLCRFWCLGSQLNGVPNPKIWSFQVVFQVVSRFEPTVHGVPNPGTQSPQHQGHHLPRCRWVLLCVSGQSVVLLDTCTLYLEKKPTGGHNQQLSPPHGTRPMHLYVQLKKLSTSTTSWICYSASIPSLVACL